MLIDARTAAEMIFRDYKPTPTEVHGSRTFSLWLESWLATKDETWHLHPNEVLGELSEVMKEDLPSAEFP